MVVGNKKKLKNRPPVVVILGHVDHGKTTILDFIKKSHIAATESGGITQHIGAYEIEYQGKKITFIDTPGHEAFSAMRSRGAKVADIAVLVVAADEGVKPQTKEAVEVVKKADISPIVAINKIDKPGSNPFIIHNQLSKMDMLVEPMGGKIPCVEISGKTGKGINDLLEVILLVAEMADLKEDASKPAEGLVIESHMDSLRGITASVLLRNGKLKVGDIVGTASTCGKIRILENFKSEQIQEAGSSMPIIILGFETVPVVGETVKIFSDIESAKNYVEKNKKKQETAKFIDATTGKKVINLILKADVSGSIEAIEEVLKNLPQDKIILRILKKEAGEINESDVKLARASNATILGFRVKTSPTIISAVEQKEVRVLNFDIIYELIQKVRQIMERRLESQKIRVSVGKVKITNLFIVKKNRQIIGGKVISGEIVPSIAAEIFREADGELKSVGKGRVIEIQQNKRKVEKVAKGREVGMLFESGVKVEEKDVIEVYREEMKKIEL